MKKHWEPEELIEHFAFLPEEFRLLRNKTGSTRLGFAVLLKFFQHEARFPSHMGEILTAILTNNVKQLQLEPDLFAHYPWT